MIFLLSFRLVSQIVFSICDTYIRNKEADITLPLSRVHPAVMAVGLAFPIFIVIINELVKHREIK